MHRIRLSPTRQTQMRDLFRSFGSRTVKDPAPKIRLVQQPTQKPLPSRLVSFPSPAERGRARSLDPCAPWPRTNRPSRSPTPPSASAARKLPIKRRSPWPSSSPPSSSSPASSDPLRAPAPGGACGGGGSDQQQQPFKFPRIWSESDELRFLQGLLGCGAQGLVVPRDLNVFYDRFSESISSPWRLPAAVRLAAPRSYGPTTTTPEICVRLSGRRTFAFR